MEPKRMKGEGSKHCRGDHPEPLWMLRRWHGGKRYEMVGSFNCYQDAVNANAKLGTIGWTVEPLIMIASTRQKTRLRMEKRAAVIS